MSTDELMKKLFRWRKEIQFEDVHFYLRIVGDQVVEDARQAALLASRKMRKALRDQDSDMYLLHIDPIKDFTDEELQTTLVILASQDVMTDYVQNTPRPIVAPLPDNPTLEQQEQHQAALEEQEQMYIESMKTYIEDWRQTYAGTLKQRPREFVEKQYARHRTDRVCENVFSQEFQDRLVAASIYSSDTYKTRMFTYEEYRDLPGEVRTVLEDAYKGMVITPDDLKN